MKLIDRTEELQHLNALWQSGSAQLVVIYGKRRVGKTALIRAFIDQKPSLYFLADRSTEAENLRLLGQVLGEHFADPLLIRHGLKDWYDCFAYLKRHVQAPLVLAIDEFPYLVEANKALSSIMQKAWDETLKELPIYLILCGSSIGMMEQETLAYRAPLYGRRTAQLLVKPLAFSEARQFYPQLGFAEFLSVYAVAGGNPAYLLKLRAEESLPAALRRHVFSPTELLFQEIEFLLKEELREPRVYMSLLRAIAAGCRKFGEIVNETGIEKSSLHKYLFTLQDLHLIGKEVSVTERRPAQSRQGLYYLHDPFVKFWFTHVYPFQAAIELGNGHLALQHWKAHLDASLAAAYERVAPELLMKHQGRLFPVARIGRWWDRHEEIDVVAVNEQTNQILFAEVKWSKKPVGINISQDLRRKASLVPWGKKGREERFALLSKSGFTPEMRRLSKTEGIFLFKEDRCVSE